MTSSLHNKLFITAPEASREIGLCLSTWRKLIKEGTIRSFTIPGLRGRFIHRYHAIALFQSMSQSLGKTRMSNMKKAGVASPASE